MKPGIFSSTFHFPENMLNIITRSTVSGSAVRRFRERERLTGDPAKAGQVVPGVQGGDPAVAGQAVPESEGEEGALKEGGGGGGEGVGFGGVLVRKASPSRFPLQVLG